MGELKDIKPVFLWAKANGDAKIIDRILVKNLPFLLQHNYHFSEQLIFEQNRLDVNLTIYELLKQSAQELVGLKYEEAVHV